MEKEVCSAGFERAAGAALGEREAKATGAGSEPGPAHPLGDCRKKTVRPRARRELAELAQQDGWQNTTASRSKPCKKACSCPRFYLFEEDSLQRDREQIDAAGMQHAVIFTMRSMASGPAFHRAYPCAKQEAFLKAHELEFAYFEGVFRRLRYDNLSSAMKKILRGQQRELTSRYIAFRSHWHNHTEFCTPSEGLEKGGVEGEVGYFRRNHWVPVLVAADLQALNRKLLEDCRADENRIVSGQTECMGIQLLTEKEHPLPLATEPFDLAKVSYPGSRKWERGLGSHRKIYRSKLRSADDRQVSNEL